MLESGCRVLRFNLGCQLCDDEITARIVVILRVKQACRPSQRPPNDSGKIRAGHCNWRCQSVAVLARMIAAEEIAVPSDQLWLDLYSQEATFRHWCDQQLWPQELLKLLEVLEETSPQSDSSALEKLEGALQLAERCSPNQAAVSAALEAGKRVYVTSAWGDLTIGQPIRSSMDLPPCKPFALRLVSLPASFGPEVTQDTQRKTADLLVPGASVQEAEVLPPVSSFSPERNIVEQLTLVRADGSVKETLACFQMLAQLMELPFRRDSIEQILEDHLRRGLNPNLQLCGQLAVTLDFM